MRVCVHASVSQLSQLNRLTDGPKKGSGTVCKGNV